MLQAMLMIKIARQTEPLTFSTMCDYQFCWAQMVNFCGWLRNVQVANNVMNDTTLRLQEW